MPRTALDMVAETLQPLDIATFIPGGRQAHSSASAVAGLAWTKMAVATVRPDIRRSRVLFGILGESRNIAASLIRSRFSATMHRTQPRLQPEKRFGGMSQSGARC